MLFKPTLSLPRNSIHLDNSKICEIRFRVPYWMKEDFHKHCEAQDVPASHLLRQYIRQILLESQEPTK